MNETYLDGLLDKHVPAPSPLEDWQDVLDRARHDRRRIAIFAIVAVALVLVPAALAIGGQLGDWFRGKPAPAGIREDFVEFNSAMQSAAAFEAKHGLKRKAPEAIVAKAHGVIALKTADGPVYLWAAPRRGGGICWLTQLVAHHGSAGGGCDDAWPLTAPLNYSYGGSIAYPSEQFIVGRAASNAASVRVAFSNGDKVTLPVVEGLFIGAYPRHVHPLVVASYTSAGARIAVFGTLAGGTSALPPDERKALSRIGTHGKRVQLPRHDHGVQQLLAAGYRRSAALLAVRGGRAYYRLRRVSGQFAYAVGPARPAGGITKLVGPARPRFPSIDNPLIDLSTVKTRPDHRTPRFVHVGGVVADGVARIVVKDREGRGLLWLPVRDNVYDSGSTPVPPAATQLDAQASDGQTVARVPR